MTINPLNTSERRAGIMLHPTSLPGRFGIGDLGQQAHQFAEFLAGAGISLWQVLPLGPTGYGDSPYQCFSAFAGNPLLISLEALAERGYLNARDLNQRPVLAAESVDFGAVIAWKIPLLRRAFEAFQRSGPVERAVFDAFCRAKAAG